MHLDARIPVRIVSSPDWPPVLPPADPQAVLLIVGPAVRGFEAGWAAVRQVDDPAIAEEANGDPHPAGCACCVARPPLAMLLSTLFQERARGTLGLFRRVWMLTSPAVADRAAIWLASDPLVAGRYRIGEN